MARIRTIKPDFFVDEKLNEVSRDARLLFIGLLVHSDDMGRQQYSPSRTRAQIFPHDQITDDAVDSWINELADLDLIKIYKAYSHTQRYIWIPGFLRHQVINRPGHSKLPPYPHDYGPDCRCGLCKKKRLAEDSPNGREPLDDSSIHGNVPSGTHGITESVNQGISESVIQSPEVGSRKWEVGEEQHQPLYVQKSDQPMNLIKGPSEPTWKHGHPAIVASDEIARPILRSLGLDANPNNLKTLADSVRVRARSKSCSVELAGQQIWAQAAYLAKESPPDDWAQWFADARYDYVPQGDKRLTDKTIEARPVCGGRLCIDGWERYKLAGTGAARLRRCPDCQKLW